MADRMCLNAGLIHLVPALVLHVHGLAKKVASPETIFGLGKVDENGVTHLCLPSYFCVDLRQITQVCEHGFFQQITAVTFHCESVAYCRR